MVAETRAAIRPSSSKVQLGAASAIEDSNEDDAGSFSDDRDRDDGD
ncbi:hypothetical protein HNR49_002376 [Halobacterium salinarum]|uniref:Uncharacterized protein n=1 Tax=Halobacterium salinarum TaxID=2242 RepID=A0A841HE07_HALSI|nr:hypothetical protein [Halobacterium salinarum]MBB6090986.1 hypothetical protein [Halobacterium salinarum]